MFHSAHRIRFKLYQIGKKACYILKICKFYIEKEKPMLAGLKVSSLTCKYVFYRPERNGKAGPLGIEFCKLWNETMNFASLEMPMDRA